MSWTRECVVRGVTLPCGEQGQGWAFRMGTASETALEKRVGTVDVNLSWG